MSLWANSLFDFDSVLMNAAYVEHDVVFLTSLVIKFYKNKSFMSHYIA